MGRHGFSLDHFLPSHLELGHSVINIAPLVTLAELTKNYGLRQSHCLLDAGC